MAKWKLKGRGWVSEDGRFSLTPLPRWKLTDNLLGESHSDNDKMRLVELARRKEEEEDGD